MELLADLDTHSFGTYLQNEYSPRREQIAACYRLGFRINVNMFLESFHNDLKYRSVMVKETLLCHYESVISHYVP